MVDIGVGVLRFSGVARWGDDTSSLMSSRRRRRRSQSLRSYQVQRSVPRLPQGLPSFPRYPHSLPLCASVSSIPSALSSLRSDGEEQGEDT